MHDLAELKQKLQALEAAMRMARVDAYAAACAPEVAEAASKHYGMRRADRPGRDQRVYRLGAAIEVAGADHLDDFWLLGAMTAPEVPVWLAQEVVAPSSGENDGRMVILTTLFDSMFQDPARRNYLIHAGAWRRHHWSQSAYRAAVAEFEASSAALGGRWETRPLTEKQLYAIEQISRVLAAVEPGFVIPELSTRRAAHDWISEQRGNPRFANDITPPAWKNFR